MPRALPARSDVENIPKAQLYKVLKHATGASGYGKGEDSFKLLALIDPKKLRDGSYPWAKRFFDELERRS